MWIVVRSESGEGETKSAPLRTFPQAQRLYDLWRIRFPLAFLHIESTDSDSPQVPKRTLFTGIPRFWENPR